MTTIPFANPCPPGTLKHATCQAAIEALTVAEASARLEKVKRGAGDRVREYMDDLRNEDQIDIRIEGGRLGIHGRI